MEYFVAIKKSDVSASVDKSLGFIREWKDYTGAGEMLKCCSNVRIPMKVLNACGRPPVIPALEGGDRDP